MTITIDASAGNSAVGTILSTFSGKDIGPDSSGEYVGYYTFLADISYNCDLGYLEMRAMPAYYIDYFVGDPQITLQFLPMNATETFDKSVDSDDYCSVETYLDVYGTPYT